MWLDLGGVFLCPRADGMAVHLRALASYYTDQGGALWVANRDDTVVGMIGTKPLEGGTWEICKVYVSPDLHGSGLGHALLERAEAHAIAKGATRLALWSDTRFDRAHRFYEKRSYVRSGPIRVLHDISDSLEYAYAKPVEGIEILDAAAAASAIPHLSSILIGCVAEGAGVSFLPPLALETARAFWRGTATKVAAGTLVTAVDMLVAEAAADTQVTAVCTVPALAEVRGRGRHAGH